MSISYGFFSSFGGLCFSIVYIGFVIFSLYMGVCVFFHCVWGFVFFLLLVMYFFVFSSCAVKELVALLFCIIFVMNV